MLICELLLRCLPVSTATETDYYLNSTIISYPPKREFVISTGWNLSDAHHHQTNNFGFLTRRDFFNHQNAIALIGDSYVEANMLREDERLGAQLENKLGNHPVYALGGPGSSLLDYAERARFANEKFSIKDFVFVLETGDIKQTLCGSGNIHGPCIDPKTLELRSEAQPKTVSFAKRILRQSALAQYLFSQLRLKPESVLQKMFPEAFKIAPPAKNTLRPVSLSFAAIDTIVKAFFANLPQQQGNHLLLILDNDRNCSSKQSTPEQDRLIQLATLAGAQLLLTKPIFCDFFNKTHLSLAVSPTDAHWNRLGHKLVADAIATQLNSSLPIKP